MFGTQMHCELTDRLLARPQRVNRNIGINVFHSCCSKLFKNENTLVITNHTTDVTKQTRIS